MGDVIIKQITSVTVAKNPTVTGAAIVEKDYEKLNVQYENTAMNENEAGRINLAAAAADVAVSMGTVALGKMLVVDMDQDIELKVVNDAGTSQALKFLGGRPSIMHMEFTGLLVTNPSVSTVAKGKIVVVGD